MGFWVSAGGRENENCGWGISCGRGEEGGESTYEEAIVRDLGGRGGAVVELVAGVEGVEAGEGEVGEV